MSSKGRDIKGIRRGVYESATKLRMKMMKAPKFRKYVLRTSNIQSEEWGKRGLGG